jgi:hypothetical protein
MTVKSLKGASTIAMLGATLAFVIVLFLDWHRTSVDVAGVAQVRVETMGWSGWGWLAGAAAFALIVVNLNHLRARSEIDPILGIADLLLAVPLVCATVASVFSGSPEVQAGPVGVEAGTTLWPAWVALALSCATTVGAALVALPEAWQPGQRPTESLARGA